MKVGISNEKDFGNGESSFKIEFAYEKSDFEKAQYAYCSDHGIYKKLSLVRGCTYCVPQSSK